mmetsp:Transcript_9991/g.18266  ORF Transcript_9991/g.18266 Transcript_9991/m.18266 type:complete len:88 (+) Transcript_9991:922-1185(+)
MQGKEKEMQVKSEDIVKYKVARMAVKFKAARMPPAKGSSYMRQLNFQSASKSLLSRHQEKGMRCPIIVEPTRPDCRLVLHTLMPSPQ